MAEGFFRSKKGFTVVQNEITRDAKISLKAKGLYLVIQAYISMPDKKWTKEDFRNLTKEGKKAFDSAWKELKDFGYLKVHFMPDNGKWQTEYELLDEPDLGPHTLYHNSEGEVSSDNLTRAEKKRQTQ
ncbi:MAG: RNA replicase, partial [Tyzzerella sp.]|nr:RNA replicase [Tyzzerella sp.]